MGVNKIEVYPGAVHLYCESNEGTIRETVTKEGLLMEMFIGIDGEFVVATLSKEMEIW